MITYLYDDREHPDRVTRTVQASAWTEEDQALMEAWSEYQDSLCPGCKHPKATAWHHMNEDAFDHEGDFICWGCTAAGEPEKDGRRKPVTYPVVVDTRDYTRFPLPGPPEPQLTT